METLKIMSAGPTSVHPDVLQASRSSLKNTDLDADYLAFQKSCEQKISKLLHTEQPSFIMLGEAMLGLDGAMASFIEPGDRVLVLENGVFGRGFHSMARAYGAETVAFVGDSRRGISVDDLEKFLDEDDAFKLATMVHCETPTGITNDVHAIGQVLNAHNILSVSDSVSAIAGEQLDFDASKLDVVIGGSQKCLSALTGLTTITLSARAQEVLVKRQTPVAGWYQNFQNYLQETDGFAYPYTQSDTLVNALAKALDLALNHDFVSRHIEFSSLTRQFVQDLGYEIYAQDSYANTVTTVLLKNGLSTQTVLDAMRQKGYMLSGAMADLSGKAFRIGHMGNNIANPEEYKTMLDALAEVLGEH